MRKESQSTLSRGKNQQLNAKPITIKKGLDHHFSEVQGNLYSGDTLGTKASVPWIEVFPEWRLGLGFVNI